ncbi:MAG: ATP-binding protein [bacterium]|nr:ATP-binding protein [bacterium]
MSGQAIQDWQQASSEALEQALGSLLERLEARERGDDVAAPAQLEDQDSQPNALDQLIGRFGLTTFERDLLLLCAGCELDARFGDLVAGQHARRSGDVRIADPSRMPTFSLALAMLDDGHWSALAPDAVLRRARLIHLEPGSSLASRPLAIEEAVLHGLTGRPQLDERLRPYVRQVMAPPALTAGQERAVERQIELWGQVESGRPAAVQLLGSDAPAARAAFAAACHRVGLSPFMLDLHALPRDGAEREEVFDLWARDAVLGDFALAAELHDLAPGSGGATTARLLIERLPGFLVLTGEAPLAGTDRPLARVELAPPSTGEQHGLWTAALGTRAESLNGQLDRLVQQFTLSPPAIREIAGATPESAGADGLWRACRNHARGGLDDLAQRIEAVAGWDELVLPAAQLRVLRQVATHVRQRARVYEQWGFADHGSRGLGISALFAGTSGTGKTMAAEVLARELELDLYRIDLSATVSKYIGETEKNLRRIFDAAEASGAILLFDEADALFGKRSEVKDSHDRYANLEISYLLQRIEAYRGLAILTTNLKRNLDEAFTRRLRFILQFPHPGPDERAEIWRRIFPPRTPVDGLDAAKLARLSITGGHIKSIALHAAVLAADEDSSVAMRHVLQASHAEYAKLGKALSDGEVRGWV